MGRPTTKEPSVAVLMKTAVPDSWIPIAAPDEFLEPRARVVWAGRCRWCGRRCFVAHVPAHIDMIDETFPLQPGDVVLHRRRDQVVLVVELGGVIRVEDARDGTPATCPRSALVPLVPHVFHASPECGEHMPEFERLGWRGFIAACSDT